MYVLREGKMGMKHHLFTDAVRHRRLLNCEFWGVEGSDAELIEDSDGDGMRSARLGNLAPYM